jgi:hypothetical protein
VSTTPKTSYYHHLDAVAAAPSPRADLLTMVMLPTSLIEGLSDVAKRRGMDRGVLIAQSLTSLVAREMAHLDRYDEVAP